MTEIDLDELMENLAQCRRCGICREAVYEDRGFDGVCPVWRNSAGFETSFMRGRIQVAIALLDGVLEKTQENTESLFTCMLCGNCTQICAAEFDPTATLEKVRAVLNDAPNHVRDTLAERVKKSDNPYGETPASKTRWMDNLGYEVPSNGETLYFVGCTAALRLPEVAKATLRVLRAAGEDFAILSEESCCGSVLLRTGRYDDALENAKKLAEAIRDSGAKRIIVTCAGCQRTLKKDFEEMGVEIPEVVHALEYVLELLKEKKIPLSGRSANIRVTYHDPCHSGRELGMYDEPRELLSQLPGVELVEMETNRETAMCCGAGGGLRSYDPELSKRIAADRVQTAEKTGALILATACPFCEMNLEAGARLRNSTLRVVDVMGLLAENLGDVDLG